MTLSGKKVVFSGFRDDDLVTRIISACGKVMTAVSGLTNILVFRQDGKKGDAKRIKATTIGTVEIIELDSFIKKYLKVDASSKSSKSSKSSSKYNASYKPSCHTIDYMDPLYKDLCKRIHNKQKVHVSVNDVENLMNIKLYPGDIIDFFQDNYTAAFFVTSQNTWLAVLNYEFESVEIPLVITNLFVDALSSYSDIIRDMDNYFGQVILDKHDSTIKKLFQDDLVDVYNHAEFIISRIEENERKEMLLNGSDSDSDDLNVPIPYLPVLFYIHIYYQKHNADFQVTKDSAFFRKEVAYWLKQLKKPKPTHVELSISPRWSIGNMIFPIKSMKSSLNKLFPSKQWSIVNVSKDEMFNIKGPVKELEAFYSNLREK